jgi:regulation of enolase protein 1 (concanavalin A-like superfamily)
MLRQAYFREADPLQIGVMACAPTGNGFPATLEDFQVRSL